MRSSRRRLGLALFAPTLPRVRGTALAVALIATTMIASSARADEAPAAHRVEAALRVGALFPGDISPNNFYHHDTSLAPSFSLDPSFVIHPNFAIGAYLQLTPYSFDRTSGSTVVGSGDGFFASGGFAGKARFTVSDALLLRLGFTLGRNAISFDGVNENGSKFEASGGGLNFGATGDAVWRLTPKLGVSTQLGFLSQVAGSAEVSGPPTNITGGPDRDFSFTPKFFLTVGPELFL